MKREHMTSGSQPNCKVPVALAPHDWKITQFSSIIIEVAFAPHDWEITVLISGSKRCGGKRIHPSLSKVPPLFHIHLLTLIPSSFPCPSSSSLSLSSMAADSYSLSLLRPMDRASLVSKYYSVLRTRCSL
ncbi:hypothetical protein OIU84_026123 [Salix udensis]|uniref:Uncharacterized protein n=1 Tax=Salix udensis TaxID=889485 RepID=A0AAD6KL88_9ROSI|nr:hypothetical protein OIU84_026123 [Salix udensis]